MFHKEKILFKCNEIHLETNANGLEREFTFKGIKPRFRRNIERNEEFSDKGLFIYVKIKNKKNKLSLLTKFRVLAYYYPPEIAKEFYIEGFVDSYDGGYGQNAINMILNWQNRKKAIDNWFDLPVGSFTKHAYFVMCSYWTAGDNLLNIQDKYIIDISYIKEKCDLSYLCGLEFIGDRGYLGIDYRDLRYYFRNLVSKGHSFEGIKLYLLNIDKPYNEEMATFYQEYKKLFEECKFDVIELKSGEIIP